jgi:hypothetical protein
VNSATNAVSKDIGAGHYCTLAQCATAHSSTPGVLECAVHCSARHREAAMQRATLDESEVPSEMSELTASPATEDAPRRVRVAVRRSTTTTFGVNEVGSAVAGLIRPLLLCIAALSAGCAPTLLLSTMKNPARTADKIEASQTYNIGPYQENHEYTLGLSNWSPSSIDMRVELRDVDRCASPESYTFVLVDDHGARTELHASGEPTTTTQPGREHRTLTVTKMSGVFPAAISSATSYVVVQMRPLPGTDCPTLDFKWNLQ